MLSRQAEGARFTQYLIFFSFFLFCFRFFVLLFSINIYLNNCYLIKDNEQQEKYRDFREKVERRSLNIWMKQSEFLSFPTIYCGKTRVDNHLISF